MSIIGLDPGTETLGVGVLYVELEDFRIVSSSAKTYRGSKLAGKADWISEVHGDRTGRIEAHLHNLVQIFREVRPMDIACESPFSNKKFPQSFGALVETLSAIRRAVMQYDIWKPLHLVDPPSVKNAVGVKGNKGGPEGKALMLQALLRLAGEFNYNGVIPFDQLDEHSVDALAVAYWRYKTLKQELQL